MYFRINYRSGASTTQLIEYLCLPFVAVSFLQLFSTALPWGWVGVTNNGRSGLKQAWRPGSIGAGGSDAATSSHPAPETVQMVTTTSDGSRSARSGASSARSGARTGTVGRDERTHLQRIPSMQLARVKKSTENGNNVASKPQRIDDAGGGGGSGGGGGGAPGGEKNAEDGFSWMVAVAAPMAPLHGFCLAVVGLETGMVGAAVTLVDRSVAPGKEEAAVGFLGFEQVRWPKEKRQFACDSWSFCSCLVYVPGIFN